MSLFYAFIIALFGVTAAADGGPDWDPDGSPVSGEGGPGWDPDG